jgi:hypothetical protein
MTSNRDVRPSLCVVAASLFFAAPCFAGDLDVDGWLARPGVKLVVVELYATWCKPCMEAVPRWKRLHAEHKADGLRMIVVSTRDPGGACQNPGWTPDEVVCDDQGVIADSLGAKSLPAAFLWSWQGDLLVNKGEVGRVEEAIGSWLAHAPRAVVRGDDEAILKVVEQELSRSDKLLVIAGEAEQHKLDALKAASLSARYDESLHCEIGKEWPANTLLDLKRVEGRLHLGLYSAEKGCLIAASSVEWNAKKPSASAAEAVAALLARVRHPSDKPMAQIFGPAAKSGEAVEGGILGGIVGGALGPSKLEAEAPPEDDGALGWIGPAVFGALGGGGLAFGIVEGSSALTDAKAGKPDGTLGRARLADGAVIASSVLLGLGGAWLIGWLLR